MLTAAASGRPGPSPCPTNWHKSRGRPDRKQARILLGRGSMLHARGSSSCGCVATRCGSPDEQGHCKAGVASALGVSGRCHSRGRSTHSAHGLSTLQSSQLRLAHSQWLDLWLGPGLLRTRQDKVLNFDVAGTWDPSLMLVICTIFPL